MATVRKPFNPKRQAPTNQQLHAEFLVELLSGEIKATKLYTVKHGNSPKVHLEYDDPDGEEPPDKKSKSVKFKIN